jgi:hypothetical protein
MARRPEAASKGITCVRAPVRAADKPSGGGKIRWNSGSLLRNRKKKSFGATGLDWRHLAPLANTKLAETLEDQREQNRIRARKSKCTKTKSGQKKTSQILALLLA